MIQTILEQLFPRTREQEMSWWVEIQTATPRCLYYFGPFDSSREAKLHQQGYVEDLIQEQAQGVQVEIKRCQPAWLTVAEEE